MPSKTPGFTLVEIIISVIIIGILAVVSLSTFSHFREKSNLDLSAQILESTLQKSFSQARSNPAIFGVLGTENGNKVYTFRCEEANCADRDPLNILPITKLEGGVQIKTSEYFDIRFLPPHGDIEFFDEAGEKLAGEELTLEITTKNNETKSLKIHKQSGFIEIFSP